ncbi:MAG: type II toxin-antitoxin system death-on-curing family toxin [Acidobacteriota bacterium]
MATDEIKYLSYAEAVLLHILLMRDWSETRCGVFDRALLESTLARPEQSATYERADLVRQAATLCLGLIKNHPWVGGNKRTATALVDEFLFRNGIEVKASLMDLLELVVAVEAGRWEVDEIESWLRQHVAPFP